MRKNLTLAAISVLLLTLPAAAQLLVIPAGPDLWATTDDGTTNIQLNSVQLDELCNFTGAPHSDNTVVSVAMRGVAIDKTALGSTSAVVTRLSDAAFFGYGDTVTVPIQVTALEFASVSPVRANCGFLNLSAKPNGAQPVSMAVITLEDPSGGTFSADVQVALTLQASGAQNGTTQLFGSLEDSGAEPWSVNPPPRAINPGVFNPGVVNGGRVIICRRKGQELPAWHCYSLAEALEVVDPDPTDPTEPAEPVGVE